jgi:bacterioferritin
MKGNAKVIAILNDVLKAELTAINQYMCHAEMCENWGYKRLGAVTKKNAIGEMKHAEWLMERILFLDATPNMSAYFKINIGQSVPQQLKNDLDLELDAIPRLNEGIKTAVAVGDNGSRELLEKILKDEEEHVDYLEAQLGQIKDMGVQQYLAEQIKE